MLTLCRPNHFHCLTILIVLLATANLAPAFASDNKPAKHHVTKRQAERVALSKIHGGKIRTAELVTANGSSFWSVYVVTAGAKNSKEVRVDASTGKILTVQTEKPGDQAEEPAKPH
jgi:hypothetical protein